MIFGSITNTARYMDQSEYLLNNPFRQILSRLQYTKW